MSFRLLGNSHDALEVTQDSFLKAFASLASLEKPEAFGGWLMRIVSNLSLNYRRSRKIRSQLPLDVLSIEAGDEGLSGATLQAGTYVTDKIYIGYQGQLNADPERGLLQGVVIEVDEA